MVSHLCNLPGLFRHFEGVAFTNNSPQNRAPGKESSPWRHLWNLSFSLGNSLPFGSSGLTSSPLSPPPPAFVFLTSPLTTSLFCVVQILPFSAWYYLSHWLPFSFCLLLSPCLLSIIPVPSLPFLCCSPFHPFFSTFLITLFSGLGLEAPLSFFLSFFLSPSLPPSFPLSLSNHWQ